MRSGNAVVCVTPRLSFVGVHLLACWLDQHEAFEPVVAGLKEAISEHQRTHRVRTVLCCITATRPFGVVFKP
jgi:hypothetical protein